jgi:hypothetical protein
MKWPASISLAAFRPLEFQENFEIEKNSEKILKSKKFRENFEIEKNSEKILKSKKFRENF